MKKNLLIAFSLFYFANTHAQQVISSSGNNLSGGGASVNFTLGESVIGSYSNLSVGFQQVLSPPLYAISGIVFTSDYSTEIYYGEVYLYYFDTMATEFLIADSTFLSGSGNYSFQNQPPGNYLVLARAENTMYPNAIPTYYGDTAFWAYAEILDLSSDTMGVNIGVRETPVWSGTGFCSGTIHFGIGSGKTGGNGVIPFGDPVPGIDVSLEQIPGGIIKAHTTTNDSGYYSISNIPLNTSYKLLVDIPGLPMDSSYTITINSSDSVATDLDFVVDTSSDGTAGVYIGYPLSSTEIRLENSGFRIYPNPNNGKFTLGNGQKLAVSCEVFNVFGEKVLSTIKINNSSLYFDISSQPCGIYYIQAKTENGIWVGKLAIE